MRAPGQLFYGGADKGRQASTPTATERPHQFDQRPIAAQMIPMTQQSSTVSTSRRSAFSLVELLVVIAIIGILISLLLPAVQAARESARRVQCVNNLKQLATAALNYESSMGTLPPSALLEPSELSYSNAHYPVVDQETGRQFSWVVTLLPFIEQQNVYERFDLSKSILRQANQPQGTVIGELLCPSDLAQGRFYSDPVYTEDRRFAKGNYAAYVSPYHIDMQLVYPGAFIVQGQPLEKIVDGTSRTIGLSEVRTLDNELDERGAWSLPWAGASILSFDMHHRCSNSGESCPPKRFICPTDRPYRADPCSLGQTQTPNSARLIYDTLHRCPLQGSQYEQSLFESMPCGPWIGRIGVSGFYSASPRSLHIGGVNVAFVDGHVQFLLDGVDEFTMAYQISVDDGHVEN